MNKHFKKVLIAAIATSAVFGGGSLTSHADSLDNETATDNNNSEPPIKEEVDNDVPQIIEDSNDTEVSNTNEEVSNEFAENNEEKVQPVSVEENKEEIKARVEEKSQPVNTTDTAKEKVDENIEEKSQPVNTTETAKEKVEENIEEKSQPVNTTETAKEKVEENVDEKIEEKVQPTDSEEENKYKADTSSKAVGYSGFRMAGNRAANADSLSKKDSITHTPKGKVVTETKEETEQRVKNLLKEQPMDVFYVLDVSASRDRVIQDSIQKTQDWFAKYPKMKIVNYTYDTDLSYDKVLNMVKQFNFSGDIAHGTPPLKFTNKARDYKTENPKYDHYVIFETDMYDYDVHPSYRQDINEDSIRKFISAFEGSGYKVIMILDNTDEQGRKSMPSLPKTYKGRDGKDIGYVIDSKIDRDKSLSDVFTKIISDTKTVETKKTVYPKYSINVEKDSGVDVSMTLNGKSVSNGHSFTPTNANPLKLDISANVKNTTAKEQHAKVSLLEDGKVVSSKTLTFAGAFSTSKKEVIKASTSYKANPNLKYGEKKTITTAKDGQKEIITTTNIVNGKSQSKTSEKILSNPVNGVIEVGNKKVTTTPIEFKSTTKTDPNMMKGQSKIERAGKKGLKTVTTIYEVKANDGSLINPKSTEKVDKAIDEIKVIGSKVVNKEDINFNTIYKGNSSLKYNEKKIQTEGTKGQKEIIYDGTKKVSEKVVKNPVDKLIAVGNVKDLGTHYANYKTEVKYDDKMAYGDFRIDQEGKLGKTQTLKVYNVDSKTGKLTDYKTQNKEIIKPINKIITVGTNKDLVNKIKYSEKYSIEDPGTFNYTEHALRNIKTTNKGLQRAVYQLIENDTSYDENHKLKDNWTIQVNVEDGADISKDLEDLYKLGRDKSDITYLKGTQQYNYSRLNSFAKLDYNNQLTSYIDGYINLWLLNKRGELNKYKEYSVLEDTKKFINTFNTTNVDHILFSINNNYKIPFISQANKNNTSNSIVYLTKELFDKIYPELIAKLRNTNTNKNLIKTDIIHTSSIFAEDPASLKFDYAKNDSTAEKQHYFVITTQDVTNTELRDYDKNIKENDIQSNVFTASKLNPEKVYKINLAADGYSIENQKDVDPLAKEYLASIFNADDSKLINYFYYNIKNIPYTADETLKFKEKKLMQGDGKKNVVLPFFGDKEGYINFYKYYLEQVKHDKTIKPEDKKSVIEEASNYIAKLEKAKSLVEFGKLLDLSLIHI